jgi:hypothetical protein
VERFLHLVKELADLSAGPVGVDNPSVVGLGVVEGDASGLEQVLDDFYLVVDFGFLELRSDTSDGKAIERIGSNLQKGSHLAGFQMRRRYEL